MSSEVPLSNGVSGMLSSREEAQITSQKAARVGVQLFQSESPVQAVKGAEVSAPKSSSFASLCDSRGHFDVAPFSVE